MLEIRNISLNTGSSVANRTQTQGKLNSLTFPHVVYIYITYRMLELVLEIPSLNSQTCSISKEMKH